MAILGCENALDVAEAADVRVEADGDALIVTNGRPAPIFYFAVDADLAATIDWSPCTAAPQCPSVPAQTVLRVAYRQVFGSRSGGDVLFYWWHVMEEATGARQPDSVRMLRVQRP
jgi:hypothetical protein